MIINTPIVEVIAGTAVVAVLGILLWAWVSKEDDYED